MDGMTTLTTGEAAALLRVSPKTVRRWADAGRIPAERTPGGRRRFNEADLSAWIQGDEMLANTRTLDQLPELSTRVELAEFTGFSVSALAHWAGEGTGPKPTRIGRSVRYRKRDVTAWLDSLGKVR